MRSWTLTATLVAALIAGCATVPVNLPSVTETPTGMQLPGKIIWHDLITDQPQASKKFYGELFGWEFESVGPNFGSVASANYTLIRHHGRLIGGMVDQSRLQTTLDISQWVVLLSVRDINRSVQTLRAAGGTVYTPPTELADRGHIAVVADPQGALFALLQTKDGDPVDAPPGNGDFLWNELWASDVDAASTFYRSLADYDAASRPIDDTRSYHYLATGGTPRIGILANPIEDLKPIWVTYVRILDAESLDRVVARVPELGGEILLAPEDRDIGGRVALIADPSGAGIALQTWPDQVVVDAMSTMHMVNQEHIQ
ncbi:MAG: VOC family protein [Gammaproteobacteria bacterium]|nr:VOC family protein [Gammaproteobacteria bacterium]